jgi:hypothetical protein
MAAPLVPTLIMGALFTAGSIAVAEGYNIVKDVAKSAYNYIETPEPQKIKQTDFDDIFNFKDYKTSPDATKIKQKYHLDLTKKIKSK